LRVDVKLRMRVGDEVWPNGEQFGPVHRLDRDLLLDDVARRRRHRFQPRVVLGIEIGDLAAARPPPIVPTPLRLPAVVVHPRTAAARPVRVAVVSRLVVVILAIGPWARIVVTRSASRVPSSRPATPSPRARRWRRRRRSVLRDTPAAVV